MLKKNLVLATLTFIVTATATIPFIGRAEKIGSSFDSNVSKIDSRPVTEVMTRTSEDLPQVISFEVTPFGFENRETIATRGRFLILLQNRTGRRDLNFWLARENQERIAESESQKRDWKTQVQLTPGTYIIGETHHPDWKHTIRVTN